MKALLLSAYNDLQLVNTSAPQISPDDLLIEVRACGICGSDVHGYDGSTGRRIPPIIMGHEASGVVVEVGSRVTDFTPGDRVTFDSTIYCGACDFCLRGEVNLCDDRQVIGVSCAEYRRPGAFAELLAVPARVAYHLPDDLSYTDAAMLEAVSVALHAVAVAQLHAGDSVLIVGAGMIGLLLLQAARARVGAGTPVWIADVDATRLEMAAALGAETTLNASGPELTEAILRMSAGRGADAVLEAVGHQQTVSTAIDCVRKGGTVTLVGNVSPTVTIPLQRVVSRQLRLQGSCASSGEYPLAMEMIRNGSIQVAPLISAVAPLSAGASWFERLHAREPNLMKVILDPALPMQPQPDVQP